MMPKEYDKENINVVFPQRILNLLIGMNDTERSNMLTRASRIAGAIEGDLTPAKIKKEAIRVKYWVMGFTIMFPRSVTAIQKERKKLLSQ